MPSQKIMQFVNLVCVTFLSTVAWSVLLSAFDRPISPVEQRKLFAENLRYAVYDQAVEIEIVNHLQINDRKDIRGLPGCVQKKPEVLMIGVPKAGTGTVRTFLNEHPDIAMEMNSEGVQYFNSRYQRGWLWYLSQMPCSEPGQITIENSPQYFVSESAPERVFEYNPNMKLILTLRDPVRRLESEFMQMVVGRPQYLTGDTVEKNVIHPKTGEVLAYKSLVSKSLYIVYLKHWLRFFNTSQIHIVDGDEFVVDPVKQLKEIETFLGIGSFFSKEQFAFVESRGFYCLQRFDNVECLEGGKGRPHPYISPSTIQKLKNYFKPYNDELSEIFGKRFNWS